MAGQGMGDYCVDIVMCIDGTGSMSPIINEVKNNALTFYQKFIEAMEDNDKYVSELRIKVIVFRDYICDSKPMQESEFFVLPNQNNEFRNFVANIEALGGGDGPENALEAIALALKSKWTTSGSRRRHIIMVFTDAPALDLGARADSPGYPAGMPKNLAELGSWWEGTDQYLTSTYQRKAGRLVAFVPNASPWNKIQSWNRYWHLYSEAGTGLSELDMYTVFDLLVGSF